MKKLTGLLVVLFSLFVMAGVANATTYYVKTTGNDANSGTEPSPFLTIQHAISVAVDNDQIMVNSGTYNQDGTTGPIIVPANRNGLDIIGYGPSKPVIDGSGLNTTTYQVNGFKILSDEVVINNFTIQNFIERDADINNLTQGPGAGILTGTLTSGHRFYNLDFTNCNWGVYLQTNYDVIIGSSGNGCSFANIKDDVGTSTNGGVAVYASTSGITISGTKINYNTFGSTIDQYGVMFGGSSANADYSEIKNNTFTSLPRAIDVNSITNTLTIQSNSFTTCTLPLYIHGGTSDNLDIYVLSNNFVGTTNDYEIKTDANFSGFKLYEYMVDNGNAYTGTGDNNGIIAAIHATDNEIVSDGTYRAIRNKLTTARADAEAYLGGAPTVVRVYVPAGNTIENCNTTVTTAETINFVGGNKTTSKLEFISGELILNGTGYYNFSTLYFKGSQTTGVPAYLLDLNL